MLVAVVVAMVVIVVMVVTMVVIMVVVMVMVVIVVMIVVMVVVHGRGRGRDVRLGIAPRRASAAPRRVTFFSVGLGLLEDVVDHLVLEDRRPQLDQRRRVLLVDTRRRTAPGPG